MDPTPSERARVRRMPDRGRYDRRSLFEVIDEAFVCHVGFVVDGSPVVIPMAIARNDDRILLHGSSASRLMRHMGEGTRVCVSVVHLDGLVVARSAIDSSMNYRSAVVFGVAHPVKDKDAKLHALMIISDHLLLGRWHEGRTPTDQELKATAVVEVEIEDASVKVRSGPPQDLAADLGSSAWAGEIPLRMISMPPVPDEGIPSGSGVPPSVRRFRQERVKGAEHLVDGDPTE